jgi:hypothetical protein
MRFRIVVEGISILEIEVKVPGAKAAVSASGVEGRGRGIYSKAIDT